MKKFALWIQNALLGDLKNVDLTGLQNDDFLIWKTATNTFVREPKRLPPGVTSVVGDSGDVFLGNATHSTLASAITFAAVGSKIILLNRTFTENIVLSKKLTIEGVGNSSNIDGTVDFQAGSGKGAVHNLRFGGNVTVDSGVTDLIITNNWTASGVTITDNNPGAIDKNLYSFNKNEE